MRSSLLKTFIFVFLIGGLMIFAIVLLPGQIR